MEQDSKRETMERLCAFLPSHVRERILGLLLESYGDEKRLAEEVGCSPSTLRGWAKGNGRAPSDRYMPTILSLALENCSWAEDLLRRELLEAVEGLYADLGISHKAKKGDLSLLIDALDQKSSEILWHLWWQRHARLDELAQLLGASTDMEVLFRLREVINPAAERTLGQPILEFHESRVDPLTGEKVLFSWWLEFDTARLEGAGQPLARRTGGALVDLFDEKDHIMIIAQLPSSIRLAKEAETAYKNGILRIRLGKL